MTEQSMVERVAIGQAQFDGRPWLSMPRTERERYEQRARLAIGDMRCPTEDMYQAAWGALVSCSDTKSIHAWEAMIDAALKEKADG